MWAPEWRREPSAIAQRFEDTCLCKPTSLHRICKITSAVSRTAARAGRRKVERVTSEGTGRPKVQRVAPALLPQRMYPEQAACAIRKRLSK
eukprot:5701307-Pyramimonas_sp.AAC.1